MTSHVNLTLKTEGFQRGGRLLDQDQSPRDRKYWKYNTFVDCVWDTHKQRQ